MWQNVNRLSLSVSKINFIFHPYNKPLKQHITLKINNKAVMEKYHIKYHIKYLGYKISGRFSFELQTAYLVGALI